MAAALWRLHAVDVRWVASRTVAARRRTCWRLHRVDRITDRISSEVERDAAPERLAARHRRRLRDWRRFPSAGRLLPPEQHLSGRRHDVPISDGTWGVARYLARLSAGPDHGARGTRAWRPHGLRAGARRE